MVYTLDYFDRTGCGQQKNINGDGHATFRHTLALAMTFIDMVIRLARPNRQTLERRYERIAEPLDIRGAGDKSSR